MQNYYRFKYSDIIIPFEKIIFVDFETNPNQFVLALDGGHFISFDVEERTDFEKAYIEWLERDNIGCLPEGMY